MTITNQNDRGITLINIFTVAPEKQQSAEIVLLKYVQ